MKKIILVFVFAISFISQSYSDILSMGFYDSPFGGSLVTCEDGNDVWLIVNFDSSTEKAIVSSISGGTIDTNCQTPVCTGGGCSQKYIALEITNVSGPINVTIKSSDSTSSCFGSDTESTTLSSC